MTHMPPVRGTGSESGRGRWSQHHFNDRPTPYHRLGRRSQGGVHTIPRWKPIGRGRQAPAATGDNHYSPGGGRPVGIPRIYHRASVPLAPLPYRGRASLLERIPGTETSAGRGYRGFSGRTGQRGQGLPELHVQEGRASQSRGFSSQVWNECCRPRPSGWSS